MRRNWMSLKAEISEGSVSFLIYLLFYSKLWWFSMGKELHGLRWSADVLIPGGQCPAYTGSSLVPLWIVPPLGTEGFQGCVPHLLFQVQRHLTHRAYIRIKIILEKGTPGTLLHISSIESNSVNCRAGSAQELSAGQEVSRSAQRPRRAQLWVLVLPAKQWQRKHSSLSRMIPDCLENRDRRTRNRYFRTLAFEELSRVLY